jgi:hypothetical protein
MDDDCEEESVRIQFAERQAVARLTNVARPDQLVQESELVWRVRPPDGCGCCDSERLQHAVLTKRDDGPTLPNR